MTTMTTEQKKLAIEAIKSTGRIGDGATAAGITRQMFVHYRAKDKAFNARVQRTVSERRKNQEKTILKQLAIHGRVAMAAKSAGVDRRALSFWRAKSPEFDSAVKAAIKKHLDGLGR